MAPTFHFHTVHGAWLAARNQTELYQRQMNRALEKRNYAKAALCKAMRDAADRLALTIRYGPKRGKGRHVRKAKTT